MELHPKTTSLLQHLHDTKHWKRDSLSSRWSRCRRFFSQSPILFTGDSSDPSPECTGLCCSLSLSLSLPLSRFLSLIVSLCILVAITCSRVWSSLVTLFVCGFALLYSVATLILRLALVYGFVLLCLLLILRLALVYGFVLLILLCVALCFWCRKLGSRFGLKDLRIALACFRSLVGL